MFTDATAVAEADRADTSRAVGSRLQPVGGRHDILARFRLIELGEHLARPVFVARIPAEREERVGREGDEVVERQTARDVLDVRVETAVLVNDDDSGSCRRHWRDARGSRASFRNPAGDAYSTCSALDPRVGGVTCCAATNFGLSASSSIPAVVAADRELRGPLEKPASVDTAVRRTVERFSSS